MSECKTCKSNPYYKRGWYCDPCQDRIDLDGVTAAQLELEELASAEWEGMGSDEREMWAGAAPLVAANLVSGEDYIAALALWSD